MSMPRAVRHINASRVLTSLFRRGSMSKADLARELNLTRSTVGNLVKAFVKEGSLVEDAEPSGMPGHRTGRPGLRVDLNAAHAIFVGADFAVGRITLVALDLKADVFLRRTEPLGEDETDPDVLIGRLAAVLHDFIGSLPHGGRALKGVCVTVPGVVDRDGVVLRIPIFGWNAVPLAAKLRELLRWEGVLAFENDANAFAFAELYRSRPEALSEGLCLYMDVGVGGGLISQGKLVHGVHGFAGEVGYVYIGDAGVSRSGQMPGSFESYIGRQAIVERFRGLGGAATDFDEVIAAVQRRDARAEATLSEWAMWLGRGLATLTSVLDPGRIILGGPVARLFPHAEARVLESIRAHLLPDHPLPRVERSALDEAASAVGGASVLHRNHISGGLPPYPTDEA